MEKQLSSETIFTGHVFTVKRDQVLCDNGMESVRECVYHHGGVSILAIEDGCVLLVKQYRYVPGEYLLEIPAGKLEENEEPLEAAIREFEEETQRRSKDMHHLFDIIPTPGYCSEVIHIYETNDFKIVENPLSPDDDENLEIIRMPLKDAYHAISEGKIKDGKTVIAIQHAYLKSLEQF